MKTKTIQNYNYNEKQYIVDSLLLFDTKDFYKKKNSLNIHNHNNPNCKIAIKTESKKNLFIVDEKYETKENDTVFVIQPYLIENLYDRELYIEDIKGLNKRIQNVLNFNDKESNPFIAKLHIDNKKEYIETDITEYDYVIDGFRYEYENSEYINEDEMLKNNNFNNQDIFRNIEDMEYFALDSEVVWEVYANEENPIAYIFFQIDTYSKDYKPQNEYVKRVSTMIYYPYNDKESSTNNYWEQNYKREKTSFEYFKQESISMALLLLNISTSQDGNNSR